MNETYSMCQDIYRRAAHLCTPFFFCDPVSRRMPPSGSSPVSLLFGSLLNKLGELFKQSPEDHPASVKVYWLALANAVMMASAFPDEGLQMSAASLVLTCMMQSIMMHVHDSMQYADCSTVSQESIRFQLFCTAVLISCYHPI